MSRALKELRIVGAALVWSSFFDDLMCVSRPEDSESADVAVRFFIQGLRVDPVRGPRQGSWFSTSVLQFLACSLT